MSGWLAGWYPAKVEVRICAHEPCSQEFQLIAENENPVGLCPTCINDGMLRSAYYHCLRDKEDDQ